MRSISILTLLALSVAVLGPAAAEDADTPDDCVPKAYCVAFTKNGDAGSQAVEKAWLAKIRAEFAEKDVLFLSVDLTSRGSQHQAKLLLNTLSMENIWRDYAKKPGAVVLTETEWGRVTAAMTSKTTLAEARAAFTKALASEPAMDEEGDDDDDDDDDE